jgi:hypothetical protein
MAHHLRIIAASAGVVYLRLGSVTKQRPMCFPVLHLSRLRSLLGPVAPDHSQMRNLDFHHRPLHLERYSPRLLDENR